VPDEIITPEIAATLHAEAIEERQLPTWIVSGTSPITPVR
jgi:hypothetical protein